MLETDTSQHACNDTQTDVFQAEKRHRTMVLVQKFKTSSFDIVVREPLGLGQSRGDSIERPKSSVKPLLALIEQRAPSRVVPQHRETAIA